MSLVTSSIPNMINGVSEQSYILRDPSQAEIQLNALSSVVEGLRKRPPSYFEFVAAEKGSRLLDNPLNILSHNINRDTSERYQVLFGATSIRVFDLLNKERVGVTYGDNAREYLACTNPVRELRALTVGDYTFLLNRTVKALPLADTIDAYRPEALVWVQQGAYGSDYSVTLDGVTVTFKTPSRAASDAEWTDGKRFMDTDNAPTDVDNGGVGTPYRALPQHLTADYVGTDAIGKRIFTLLKTNPTLSTKFTFSRFGSLIRIRPNGTTTETGTVYKDFTLAATDSQGDTVLRTFKDRVQNFSELPRVCFPSFRLKVMGDAATKFDDYYVRYEGNTTGGTWVEDIAANQRYKLDASTMPHALIRQADGTFKFTSLDWANREAGDATSNPLPSILSKKIRDIFFFRGRFGMVSQEQVVMSRYGDYFNLFKASATQTLDTDPIDVAVSHAKVSDINHAVTYNETLILWGQNVQFQIAATDLLTPTTVSFNQTTEFPCSPDCRPVGAGSYLYFAYTRGSKTALKEYFVDAESVSKDGTDITSHVPSYIPSGVDELVPCPTENVIIALSAGRRKSMYVYNYFWDGDRKVQSAWHRWDFGDNVQIMSAQFVESKLWVTFLSGDIITMESLNFAPYQTSQDVDFLVHLDRQITEDEVTVTYDTVRDETILQLPFPASSIFQIVAKEGNPKSTLFRSGRQRFTGYVEGEDVGYRVAGDKIIVPYQLERFWLGVPYTMKYRFSTLTMRKQLPTGEMVAVVDGRLQLRRMSLAYIDSGYFRVEVTPARRDTAIYPMTAKTVGDYGSRVGRIGLKTGAFTFSVLSKNTDVTIDLINDTFLPSTILSADWQGVYSTKGTRV